MAVSFVVFVSVGFNMASLLAQSTKVTRSKAIHPAKTSAFPKLKSELFAASERLSDDNMGRKLIEVALFRGRACCLSCLLDLACFRLARSCFLEGSCCHMVWHHPVLCS